MTDFKKARRSFIQEVHHSDDGKASDTTLLALTKAALGSKSEKNIKSATAAIRVHKKRAEADTFESRAKKKVVDGMNKSSIGNHILGWFSPKHAQ